MSSSNFSQYDCALFINISTNTLTKAQKRWRIAYVAIYFSRAMLSLAKEIVSKKENNPLSGIFHSRSYTALDIEPSTSKQDGDDIVPCPSNPNIDQTKLTKMVKDKDLYVLREFGGVEGIANNLKTDLENGIHGNDHESNPNIDQTKLTKMVKDKDLYVLREFGGVEGIANNLKTDPENGIHGNDHEVSWRRDTFGSNTYHKPPPKGLLYFVLDAFKDTTILILLVCAALSLGFGIKEHGVQEGWYEGGSIFIAVFLVVVVSALSNFRQERQFDKLSKISNNIKVDVIRDGRRQQISIFDIVAGDVVFLKIGDQIPADGLFLDGHSLQADESSMTGESEHVEVDSTENPFLFSGSKVADGYGRMLVTAVGMNTAWGEMMSSIARDSNERTPLQARLDKLTSSIGKVSLAVAFLVLVVLLIRYITGNTEDENGTREYNGSKTNINDVLNKVVLKAVVRIVSTAVTIVVVQFRKVCHWLSRSHLLTP